MKLRTLLRGIEVQDVKGSREIEITGICSNSKVVVPGNLFVAKRGCATDGHRFVAEAISGGAVALLTDIYDPTLKGITQIVDQNVVEKEALLAARYYDFPSEELFTVGITGTNGKTTTAMLIKHLLDSVGLPCGLLGTIEYIIGSHRYDAGRTTAEVTANHKMLREMVREGCQAAVMEVTSHGLDQGRVREIDYDVAVFTNLSQDHLDYHKTLENYCVAKNKLFRQLPLGRGKKKHPFIKTALVNGDDSWHTQVLQGWEGRTLRFGMGEGLDIHATRVVLAADKTSFDVSYQGKTVPFEWNLIGQHSVYNGLAAIGVGVARGLTLAEIATVMRSAPQVAGRMERVTNRRGLNVFVDFAHTPEALRNVLQCLREVQSGKKGRIITVFGCGGDRDPLKRPKMAAIVEALSDVCIVTSDNPRSEDPTAIASQISQGFQQPQRHSVELDRRQAIASALGMANVSDTVLIAGRGHEKQQIFAGRTVDFDDRIVARELCDSL